MDKVDPMDRKTDPQADLRVDKVVDKMDLQVDLRVGRSKVRMEQGKSLSLSSSIDFEGSYSCTRSTLRSHTLRQSVNPPDSFYPTDLVAVHFLVVVVVNDFGLWSIDHEVTCKWLNDC